MIGCSFFHYFSHYYLICFFSHQIKIPTYGILGSSISRILSNLLWQYNDISLLPHFFLTSNIRLSNTCLRFSTNEEYSPFKFSLWFKSSSIIGSDDLITPSEVYVIPSRVLSSQGFIFITSFSFRASQVSLSLHPHPLFCSNFVFQLLNTSLCFFPITII